MNKKDITVLPFSLEHIDGVMEIDNLSFSVPWSRNSYETELKNKFAKYIVVLNKETNKVLGFAGMWLIIDECHITNIAVHPNHRGLGIGNILMNEIIDICKEHNLTSITLEVRESNTAAKNLYYKYGFKDSGIRKGYYADNNENALLMWKTDL
ncbi:ribosomal-protein-alanine N-acetyltransferase [Clostridium botulinum]|uniref:[Ribosomal protein bS18]-alanine N-acetyltransferase n=1 Tax=Clostridium botulinum (strain Okra / Type B1) TaxID=498213 RepID=B1IFF9_CLOBK|nr:ribosomal protein S18-alanine N-acetyltransferase [Clostridium botulinum]EKX80691.1 ribosomal-protein-alanine acetyltransferase [Clostridium botulinum CFSAN001628]ACA45755.1 ribosomal-protein-alanine acetyltransferase [Clostridium botulinum B1 str. Okra]MBD5561283.1 ribosomal protein S18-alanine N-acetyltransferase [Clostridium botulinum]MBD5567417.1 ribosomal protein S18-alanine N-acetyltransferase [Clostridium botulinum]MBD5571465.1 ribosomal protein S18-alanine N-acetyltransferase [Clost